MWGTRRVYKGNGCYIKEFDYCDHYWYHKHIKMVDTINPGYYINTFYSTTRMTFIMKTVPGVNAKTLGSGIGIATKGKQSQNHHASIPKHVFSSRISRINDRP